MAKAVRVAIDMNHNSTPLLADEDVDTESFDEIIYAKLCDAVRMVEMEAPLNLLEQGHLFGDAVTWLDGGKGDRHGVQRGTFQKIRRRPQRTGIL